MFLFPLLPALNEWQHLIEFDGFTLIRAAAAAAATPAAPSLHHPTNPLARIFIAFYIIVLAVAYALNMPYPFCLSVPMAFVPAFALPFALQISSPIFMYGVYYVCFTFSRLFFLTPCFMCCLCSCCCCCVCRPEMPHFKKCFAFCFPTSCLVSVFVFVRLCIFCAVFFSNNRLARFALMLLLFWRFAVWAFGFYFAWLSVICEIYANVSAVICVEDLF